MTATDISEARVDIKEQDDAGFRMFLIAHFFLWTYPKNFWLDSFSLSNLRQVFQRRASVEVDSEDCGVEGVEDCMRPLLR
jgi:hypothetical protein